MFGTAEILIILAVLVDVALIAGVVVLVRWILERVHRKDHT